MLLSAELGNPKSKVQGENQSRSSSEEFENSPGWRLLIVAHLAGQGASAEKASVGMRWNSSRTPESAVRR